MNIAALLAQVLQIIPLVDGLIGVIKKIKDQTEADHPAVWAKVRDDWKDAVARWNTVIGS